MSRFKLGQQVHYLLPKNTSVGRYRMWALPATVVSITERRVVLSLGPYTKNRPVGFASVTDLPIDELQAKDIEVRPTRSHAAPASPPEKE